jgi:UPF0271 protein
MGESFDLGTMGGDDDVLRLVTCADIACGLYRGEPMIMPATVHRTNVGGIAILPFDAW